uniref:Uncharacterized protein n=1 Tax=Parascaris univalens TaxID=6257 RepID=A0A915B8U1_PARUN
AFIGRLHSSNATMSGEEYFDFKVKPSKKRDQKRSDETVDEEATNRVIAVARELRRANNANERTGNCKLRSPGGIGAAAKNRKDREESTKFDDNGYYHGLDRNVWKVSDYAGTSTGKEEAMTRGISSNWEDYVPDYSQHREVLPTGYISHKKNTTTDSSKYRRKKHSRRALTPREWSSRRGIAPMSYDEYEDYIPKESKSRRKKFERNLSKRSFSCTSLRRNRKHSGHRSSHRSHRHRFSSLIYFEKLYFPLIVVLTEISLRSVPY